MTCPEDAEDVVRLALSGDSKAVGQFLRSIEPAVIRIANRYAAKSGMDADDLANEARLHAVKKLTEYDPAKGVALFPFIHQHMVWRVIRVIKDLAGAARLPKHVWEHGEKPARAISIDDPRFLKPSSRDLQIEVFEKTQAVRRALSGLPARDAQILLLRAEDETLPDIGKTLGISKQAVAQAEKKAMHRLREAVLRIEVTP